ncbi:protein GLUTAMINE DUMPER 6-like [Senna tora]|uniref:Protein GLUTAMINE DUMPER 6-like n=1 Tax=Senna tora TaxID=362788 RepID=A0A834W270_9FABA|nr:protein GLUTAMINE DUMPER 6-like [Senna tora]
MARWRMSKHYYASFEAQLEEEEKMRPLNSGSSSSSIRVWKSPIPYLFGGLVLMLALISVALVVLICSYRKRTLQSSSSSSSLSLSKLPMPKNPQILESSEPNVVVIMAGDDNPTYLANPTTIP